MSAGVVAGLLALVGLADACPLWPPDDLLALVYTPTYLLALVAWVCRSLSATFRLHFGVSLVPVSWCSFGVPACSGTPLSCVLPHGCALRATVFPALPPWIGLHLHHASGFPFLWGVSAFRVCVVGSLLSPILMLLSFWATLWVNARAL